MRAGIIGHLLSFESSYRQAGVSRYTEALVRELPRRSPGDTFVVFTGPDRPPSDRDFDASVEWAHSRAPTGRPLIRIAWEQTVGFMVARRHRLDLVHAPVNVTPLVTLCPRVVTIHDLAFHHFPEQYPGPQQRYLRAMTRLSVRRATRVIAVSEATRQDVIVTYGCAPERVVTVPNGVSTEFRPLPEDVVAAFRKSEGLAEHFILFLGTLQPRKNLETLLRAYARAHTDAGWSLVVAGAAGWSYDPIFDMARDLGLADKVRFAGYVPPERLPLWYNAAGMLVYPSLYEGFGLQLVEAMACGTPVIASNTSSLPEVVGNAGLLVGARDVDGFARAIVTLARSPEMRADLRARGVRRAASFSWEATADRTLSVYREAVAESRRQRLPRERRA
ncbi:MAG TPA: glycosyltransferase family 1 protein [Thermomicrobiales bacterium]|nr:glycosyltransferase family 1 protein [Thermomicrobiales bacterium]